LERYRRIWLNSPQYQTLTLFIQILPFFCEFFVYLEYGDGGTTRQVYANRMEFNEDGTIKTLVPDEKGVGYLAVSQEQRENKALKASFSASSVRSPRTSKVK